MNTIPNNAMPRNSGSQRAVFEATLDSVARGTGATLVVVIETVGSTYVRVGGMAMFGPGTTQVGWLSGGCLEAEIGARAQQAAAARQILWMDIDTRDDEDLFSGSATGCRGRLHLVLLPLAALDGWRSLASEWLERRGTLSLSIAANGSVSACLGATRVEGNLPASAPQWTEADEAKSWRIDISPPPAVVIFGAGPETALLVPLLRATGWMTTVVEQRERWMMSAQLADHVLTAAPGAALAQLGSSSFDAALVMHHNFERDRDALMELAQHPVAFIGLLGPKRRRDDLFSVIPALSRDALTPRLHSPVGLDIGGHGPEAIALSISAQLHAWRHAP